MRPHLDAAQDDSLRMSLLSEPTLGRAKSEDRMNTRYARSAAAWLVLWVGLVAFSIACWVGLFYLGAWAVQIWGAWPIVRFALTIGVVGLMLFIISDQWSEVYMRDMERRRR